MSQWKEEELAAIAKDSSLYISIPNADGSMHSPTRIWAAQAGDDLYCRGYAGTAARWYQSAKREGKGHISSGGIEKDVRFEFVDDNNLNDQLDEGYRQKFAGSPYLEPMISEQARQATVRLIPID